MLAWVHNKAAAIVAGVAGLALFLSHLSEIQTLGGEVFCSMVDESQWESTCAEPAKIGWREKRMVFDYLDKMNSEERLTPEQEEIYLKSHNEFIKDSLSIVQKR